MLADGITLLEFFAGVENVAGVAAETRLHLSSSSGIRMAVQLRNHLSLGRLGREAPTADELVWYIGPPLRESFSRLVHTSNNTLLDEALHHYRKRFSEIGIYENSVYPGIVSDLQRIHSTRFQDPFSWIAP